VVKDTTMRNTEYNLLRINIIALWSYTYGKTDDTHLQKIKNLKLKLTNRVGQNKK